MRFDELTVGMSVELKRIVDDASVRAFAEVSGDMNPIHLDAEVASRSRFGERIAHGMFAGAMISALIASELPGPGSVYLKQELRFLKPIRVGSTVRTRLELISLDSPRRRAQVATKCLDEGGNLLVDGEATIWVPE